MRMDRGALYIKLRAHEVRLLTEMARGERRSPQDQAAHLVALGVAQWDMDRQIQMQPPLPDISEEDQYAAAIGAQ